MANASRSGGSGRGLRTGRCSRRRSAAPHRLARPRRGPPCRVVYVVDEPTTAGFAYGTLPGHPERGEEAFLIQRDTSGDVDLTVTAFSRPATALLEIVAPASRLVRAAITERYVHALRREASGQASHR